MKKFVVRVVKMVIVVTMLGFAGWIGWIARDAMCWCDDVIGKLGYFENNVGFIKSQSNSSPFKIYPSDFLVPLNRLSLLGGKFLNDESWMYDDHGAMGSDTVPSLAFVFAIDDFKQRKVHYFLAGGLPGWAIDHLQYLGENLSNMKREAIPSVLSISYNDPRATNKVVTTYWGYGARVFQFPDCYDYENIEHIKLIPMCCD